MVDTKYLPIYPSIYVMVPGGLRGFENWYLREHDIGWSIWDLALGDLFSS
jgi:hypothetical protein